MALGLKQNIREQNLDRITHHVSEDNDLSPYTRHPDFWFDDGSVIVRCGKTVFKLHRGLLSVSSTYFKEALDSYKPQLLVDRHLKTCPILVVDKNDSDDACFADLMALLYHTKDWKTNPPLVNVAGAVLSASTSMGFPRIRNHVISWFEEQWPSALPPPGSPPIPYAGDAIFHARKHSLTKVLKRAHYEFIRSPTCDAAIEANRAVPACAPLFLPVLWMRCLLSAAWAKELKVPPREIACTHGSFAPAMSPKALSAFWVARVQTSGLDRKYRYDPISGIDVVFDRLRLREEGICEGCYLKARAWVASKREAWWTILDDTR
ncbi:hypothetical protein OF83DRAFT_503053 [Amylostereum chailletii]|nr:hypothetical protein OF83DRAFT_503053 [Amylostereum chailletii]